MEPTANAFPGAACYSVRAARRKRNRTRKTPEEQEGEERKKRMTEKDQEEEEKTGRRGGEEERPSAAKRFTRGAYIHRGRRGRCCGGAHRESYTDSTDER